MDIFKESKEYISFFLFGHYYNDNETMIVIIHNMVMLESRHIFECATGFEHWRKVKNNNMVT